MNTWLFFTPLPHPDICCGKIPKTIVVTSLCIFFSQANRVPSNKSTYYITLFICIRICGPRMIDTRRNRFTYYIIINYTHLHEERQ